MALYDVGFNNQYSVNFSIGWGPIGVQLYQKQSFRLAKFNVIAVRLSF